MIKEKKILPGYKLSPFGPIPNEWAIKPLSKCTSYVDYRGKTPIKSDIGLFLVTAKNIKNGYIDYETSKEFISEHEYENTMKRGKPKIGDVLITTEAPLGNVAAIDREDIALAQRVIKYRADEKLLDKTYFKYFLLSPKFQEILNLKSTGSTVKGIKGSVLHQLPIGLPEIPEQTAIANLLSTWDSAIQTTNALIEQKQNRKNWLMQMLLTGKKRLKGFEKEKWVTLKISAISKEVSIRNKEDKDLVVLSCTKYDGLVPSLEYFGRKIYSDDLTTYKIVPKSHFAYATNHIEEGSIGYQTKLDLALISPMYTVFKTDGSVDDIYLYRVLKSQLYIHEYKKRMEGSIDRRGGLRWEEFSKIKVPVPSTKEQNAISSFFVVVDKEIELLKSKLEQIKEQKKGLMQILLTGKKRLKVN